MCARARRMLTVRGRDFTDRDGLGCAALPQQQKYLQPKCPPMPHMVLVLVAEMAGSQVCARVTQ